MKRYFYLLSIAFLILHSCSSDSNDNQTNNNNNDVLTPLTVRYELRTTSTVRSSYGQPMVTFINSTGQQQTESVPNLTSNNPWIKTVTVTSTTRPLQINLLLSTQPANIYRLWLTNAGSVTQNIYINGVLKASSTNQSATVPILNEYNIQLVQLNYIVN